MEQRIETSICERCDDLISFLYDELGDREVRHFEQHLASCDSCRTQLEGFREVRSNVVAWRDQSLGMAVLPGRANLGIRQTEKPSALTAIRQFLTLSPLWLKGAVTLASILFFAVIAFLVMSLNSKPAAPQAGRNKLYSEEEMRARVEAGIQERLHELNSRKDDFVKEPPVPPVAVDIQKPKSRTVRFVAKTRRAPLSKSERQQLAVDLGLISPVDDSDLNLLGEQINR